MRLFLEAAEAIDAKLEQGVKVALLNFSSTSEQFSQYVLDELSANLVNSGKLVIVDRKEIDLIRSETDFQFSGEVSDESAQEVGRMLGAQSIVSGSLTNIGSTYRINIKVLNVQSAAIVVQHRSNIANDAMVQALLASGGGATSGGGAAGTAKASASGGQSGGTAAQAATPAAPPAPVYKVGDTGPAGGLIFYDKGNNSGGWRYLEAAPADTEVDVVWFTENTRIGKWGPEIGIGKINTKEIMAEFNKRGGGFDTAARACDDLSVNGFDDWFLPSRDELNFMYGNLHRRDLGGFRNAQYWSSTIITNNRDVSYINFSDGKAGSWWEEMRKKKRVRAARQF
ncbi:hypothetical protein AGMMS50293_30050 [Spirochaetia bacterium]|nr:hypothetical protein AGMMS50293_30050 [Spirochaetia bacterium]